MSINNCFCVLAPPPSPNHITSVRYFIMNCARCAWAYITTAEIYCGHVRWRSFWFSECFADWLHPSCIAVGCDQQLVRRVVTPPAQHHAGTQHPQHLQLHSTGMKEKLLLKSWRPWKANETGGVWSNCRSSWSDIYKFNRSVWSFSAQHFFFTMQQWKITL